ncbi:MAG: isoprenylcysteine carboxylmethyltransferase family protein [Alteromonadaceae bacterium]|nr:isoprenylcysteine carboxylmethyltransferase family protein [Alteromonadaceae bacterium]
MSDLTMLRWFLAAFFTFVAVFYTCLVIYKKRHYQPVTTMGPAYSCHWWNHLTFRVFRAAIWLVCVWLVFSPTVFTYLVPFNALLIPQLMWSGAMFLVFGFIIAIAANFTLGDQWRSGIVQNENHNLIKKGLYGISRNPGYIGVGVAQMGFFLALPSLFSLICLLVGLFALRKQALLEEQYLHNRYHEHYMHYRSLVPRWL